MKNEQIAPGWNRSTYIALVVGGVLACVAGPLLTRDWAGFFQSYLYGFVFWLCAALGCLGLVLLHHTVRGSWGLPILRFLEAGTKTLPWLAVLFLPLGIGLATGVCDIYPWLQPERVAGSAILRHRIENMHYLTLPGFLIRMVIYFAFWIGVSAYLNRSSLRQDETRDERLAHARTNVSAPSMVLFVLTVTFAFLDLVMSLNGEWFSTIFGLYFVVAQALTALAGVTFVLMLLSDRRPFSEVVTPALTRDLGNLLLTLTMLWAYVNLSQYLIIWSANLPEETAYYLNRQAPGWGVVATVLVIGQFFAPFLMLLAGRTKRTPTLLMLVALLILAMRVLDFAYVVVPALPRQNFNLWTDLLPFAGIGAIWLAVYVGALKGSTLLPQHDPRLAVSEVLERV